MTVAFYVASELVMPELGTSRGKLRIPAAWVHVPEAAMGKDRHFAARKDHVGRSGQVATMQSETVARSEQGAATQAVLMSIHRTLKLRGLDATKTIVAALRTSLETGTLPPLPERNVAGG